MSTRHRDELIVALRDGGETYESIGKVLSITRERVRQVYASMTRPWYPAEWVERFWSQVAMGDGCWEWQGSMFGDYGSVHYGRPIPTHRVSWELHFGPITDGLWVLHHCDNPPCVRPDHLFLGDHLDNMADRVRKHGLVARAPSMLARLYESPV